MYTILKWNCTDKSLPDDCVCAYVCMCVCAFACAQSMTIILRRRVSLRSMTTLLCDGRILEVNDKIIVLASVLEVSDKMTMCGEVPLRSMTKLLCSDECPWGQCQNYCVCTSVIEVNDLSVSCPGRLCLDTFFLPPSPSHSFSPTDLEAHVRGKYDQLTAI